MIDVTPLLTGRVTISSLRIALVALALSVAGATVHFAAWATRPLMKELDGD